MKDIFAIQLTRNNIQNFGKENSLVNKRIRLIRQHWINIQNLNKEFILDTSFPLTEALKNYHQGMMTTHHK